MGYALRILSNRGVAVICDRYLYDQLANLSAEGSVTELKYKAFMALIPRPDAAFLLRASKEIICKRRENSDSCEIAELSKAYLKVAGSGEFWVVDTDDGTKCRGEVRGILSYASKSW